MHRVLFEQYAYFPTFLFFTDFNNVSSRGRAEHETENSD